VKVFDPANDAGQFLRVDDSGLPSKIFQMLPDRIFVAKNRFAKAR